MTELLTFQLSKFTDLPQIVAIYNQTIATKTVTADLQPVTVKQREPWFQQHQNPQRPLWTVTQNQQMLGWVSLSDFYGRAAYQPTAEISLYFDQTSRHQGCGSQTLHFVEKQLPQLQISNLVAEVFSQNIPSTHFFQKNHFQRWGHLPQVADMGSHWCDVDIWGKKY